MVFFEVEKVVVDWYEKGEVVLFVFKLRRKDLSGYGGGFVIFV